jgi:hypothetical protein
VYGLVLINKDLGLLFPDVAKRTLGNTRIGNCEFSAFYFTLDAVLDDIPCQSLRHEFLRCF